jgi:HlyD family secretion protein
MTNESETSRTDVARTLGVETAASAAPWWRHRRRWLWLVVGVAVVAVGVGRARGGNGTSLRYRTEPALRGELRITVTATGALEPTNQVDVGSEVSGTILQVLVEEDDRVRPGQVLARIDTTKLEAQARQLSAALAAAQSRLLQAQATREEASAQLGRLTRAQEASGGTLISQQDLATQSATAKRAEADEASARASVSQAEASLQAARTDIAKAVIRSPIGGIVLTRTAEPGQTVAAAFQAPVLFKIAEDLARMELRVDVDEADVAQVRAGEDATFSVDAYPNRSFRAQIKRVRSASKTTEGVVTYEAVLAVDNSTLELRPGMTATAELTASRVKDALLVPNAALRFTPPASVASAPAEAGGGSLVSRLLPRPPGRRTSANGNGSTAHQGGAQRVWTLQGETPVPVAVQIGATDGKRTQVLGGEIAPGLALVVESTGKE